MESRRDFLKKSILLTGASGLAASLPESVQRAFAIAPNPGTTYLDAEHIVILMQENRSFDHALGTLQGVRGFNDPRALRQPNGDSVFLQTDASGKTYAPWRLDIKDTRATWMGSLPHSRESQVDAWSNGHHNAWLDAKRSHNKEHRNLPLTMGFYNREDLPFYYALADAFTVCDHAYCGAMTSTTPNRLLLWSGTVREQQNPAARAYMRNSEVDFGEMTWTTYPERLQQAGVSWKVYQNDLSAAGGKTGEEDSWLSNFTDNALEFFARYNVHLNPKYGLKMQEEIAAANAEIKKLQKQIDQATARPDAARQMKSHLSRLEKVKREYERSQAKLSDLPAAAQDLHRRAFVTNPGSDAQSLTAIDFEEDGKTQQMNVPRGDVLAQFRSDVNTGKLPTVSWLVAPENFSDHPSAPWYGAWYVSETMDILTRNPEVWKKTIFILTYDENDGYFDHAPSFVAADPTRPETGGASGGIDTGLEYASLENELFLGVDESSARGAPVGLGFRIPMIVASPWTRGGWVNSEVFDHTSTIRFLEGFLQAKYSKPVTEPNISPWRRAICGDMTSIFRPSHKDDAALHYLDRNAFVESIQRARHKQLPAGYRTLTAADKSDATRFLPVQEPGIRPACAIPCEPFADGGLNPSRKAFALNLRAGNDIFGAHATGIPFNVYAYGPKNTAATFVVRAGDTLDPALPFEDRYDIAVHGPNGFYRAFTGSAGDPALQVACASELAPGATPKPTGNIALHLASQGRSYTVHIADNAYTRQIVTRQVAAGTPVIAILDLGKQHGWYDFTVTVDGSSMTKRFAGHVETGASSFTDPLMGRALT